MVVGANGTGKSSLLNAICLGLGGNPSILGRADDVRAFIQHDATVAEISITLQGGHTFRRVLDRTKGTVKGRGRGASTYFINDKPASQDEVLEIVRTTYQIRLENLCTFLPQDKVGSFSAMDHKQLLAATQQTVPNNLYERHLELIADEEAVRHSSTDWEALESKLTTLQQEHGRLEEAKEKMELREKMMERMKLLEQKKVWLEVEVLREQARELKTHRTEKKNVLREKGDQLAPMEEQLAEIRAVLDAHNQAYKQLQQKEAKLKEVLSKQKDKYAAHDDAFEQEIMEWRDWANQIQDLKRQVEVAEQKVVDLRTTLEEMPSLESLQEIEKTSKEDFIGLRSQVKGAHRSLAAMQDKIRECEETSKRWGNKLNALANQSKQRRENIFRKHPNLGKVHQWVQENASRFRKPVCGPICCEVNPSSPVVAALVEQHVSNKIWNSFVVQTNEDYQLLFHEVREKLKIPVNVFNVGNQEWQSKRPYSDPKMQVLREQHGVLGYMDELVECSDAARQVLCNMSGIDKLLVGSAKTQESIDKRNLLAFLSEPEVAGQPLRSFAIATESQKYNCIISRYSKMPNIRQDTIRPARLLASGTDPAEQQHAEEQLRVAHEALQSLRPDFQTANDEHQRVEAAAQEAKASFDTAKVRVASFLKYQGKLENAMKKRDDLKERAGQGTDTEEVKRRADLLKNRKMASLSALEVHAAKQEELLQVNLAQAAALLSKSCAVARDHQVR
jgi:chromosome segregation ATPase